jgi:alkylhydroperoxidase family enzyme
MARAMIDRPDTARLAPRGSALLALATAVTERPWALGAADLERARAAGLGDDAILHAVVLSSFFNYLNRVADAIDLEYDYESKLPRPDRDPSREPIPRPPRESWPRRPAFTLRLADRAATAEAFGKWRAYVRERDAPLSRRDRAVLMRAVAASLCDARTVDAHPDAAPRSAREELLASYADVLSRTPWRLDEALLHGLRGLGLDDRGLLDVISVASFQTTASRLELVLTL